MSGSLKTLNSFLLLLLCMYSLCLKSIASDNHLSNNENGKTLYKMLQIFLLPFLEYFPLLWKLCHFYTFSICRYCSYWRWMPSDARHSCATVSWLCAQTNTILCLRRTMCKLHSGQSKSLKYFLINWWNYCFTCLALSILLF